MKAQIARQSSIFSVKNLLIALKHVKDGLFNGKPAQLAAGIAYFGTLSFFPLVAALVAIASLTLSTAQVATIVNGLATYVPRDIASLLSTQLQNATMHTEANIVVLVFALGISIFGVSGAMDSIIKAVTTIYGVKETRSFVRQKLLSIGLTIGFIAAMALVLPLLFIGPNVLTAWNVAPDVIGVFSVLRWIMLLAIAMVGVGVVYHFALPGRHAWRWLSWGSVIATLLWLLVTAALFIYLQYFANFSNSYSLFAGIIALMMWINFSALAVLIGAYVDHKLGRLS